MVNLMGMCCSCKSVRLDLMLYPGFIQEAAHQIREHSRVFEDYFREHFENIYMIKFRR